MSATRTPTMLASKPAAVRPVRARAAARASAKPTVASAGQQTEVSRRASLSLAAVRHLLRLRVGRSGAPRLTQAVIAAARRAPLPCSPAVPRRPRTARRRTCSAPPPTPAVRRASVRTNLSRNPHSSTRIPSQASCPTPATATPCSCPASGTRPRSASSRASTCGEPPAHCIFPTGHDAASRAATRITSTRSTRLWSSSSPRRNRRSRFAQLL